METLCYIIIEICIAIVSAGIIALVAYLFKRKLKGLFFGNDLLPASKVPNINVNLYDGGAWDANGIPISSLVLLNEGNLGVSKIRVFHYKHLMQNNKIAIEVLSKSINYQRANLGCGEGVSIELKNLDQLFLVCDTTQGLFIEMIDEYNTVFCQTVYIYKDVDNCLKANSQSIVRLRQNLPMRKISKNPKYLTSKYGLDTSVG